MRTMGYMPTEMELIELGQQIRMNCEAWGWEERLGFGGRLRVKLGRVWRLRVELEMGRREAGLDVWKKTAPTVPREAAFEVAKRVIFKIDLGSSLSSVVY